MVGEVEPGVTVPEVLEQRVERQTVEQAPRTRQVGARLRLLPSLVLVQEVVKDPLLLRWYRCFRRQWRHRRFGLFLIVVEDIRLLLL